MSLRSLLAKVRYSRARQECPETAGLIISQRLKDLLANSEESLNAPPKASSEQRAGSEESVTIEENDGNSPAVKSAA